MVAARFVRDEARALVPVRTGLLRSAIFASQGKPEKWPKGPSVIVGVNAKKAPHGHLIEFGTARAPAHPFLRPAVRAVRPMTARIMAEIVQRKIAKVERGLQ